MSKEDSKEKCLCNAPAFVVETRPNEVIYHHHTCPTEVDVELVEEQPCTDERYVQVVALRITLPPKRRVRDYDIEEAIKKLLLDQELEFYKKQRDR